MIDMNTDVGFIFTDALTEVISTVSGFTLEVLSQQCDDSFGDMTGVLGFHGELSGVLFISSSEADLRTICSYMIGVHFSEVSQRDIEDALCELTNMTAGSAKLRFGYTENVFNLSLPFIIKGKDVSVAVKDRTCVITRTLGNENISIKLKVVCN